MFDGKRNEVMTRSRKSMTFKGTTGLHKDHTKHDVT